MQRVNHLFLQDARELNTIFESDTPSVDVTVTSPPYWNLKNYGADNQIGFGQSKEDYLADLEVVFRNCLRVTKDTGSLWVVVDDYRDNGVLSLLPWEVAECAKRAGWIMRDLIIWDKQHTLPWHGKGQMRNVIEYILFFTKSDKYKFEVDRVKDLEDISRWWIDFPERFNPKGKTPTNIWSIPIRTQGTWRRFSKMNHHCPFPTELVARILELCTDPDDLVFDPFAGSGVVLAQAAAMNRLYIGCEINNKYIDMFNDTIKSEVAREWEQIASQREKLVGANADFERMIMMLRALKYTRQVTKPFISSNRKESASNPKAVICSAVIPKKYVRKQPFEVSISVVVDQVTGKLESALKTARDRMTRPPLSRYEITAHVEIITAASLAKRADLINRRFYVYPDYKPRKHEGGNLLRKWLEGERLAEYSRNPKVPMLANIAVDVAWAMDG